MEGPHREPPVSMAENYRKLKVLISPRGTPRPPDHPYPCPASQYPGEKTGCSGAAEARGHMGNPSYVLPEGWRAPRAHARPQEAWKTCTASIGTGRRRAAPSRARAEGVKAGQFLTVNIRNTKKGATVPLSSCPSDEAH